MYDKLKLLFQECLELSKDRQKLPIRPWITEGKKSKKKEKRARDV